LRKVTKISFNYYVFFWAFHNLQDLQGWSFLVLALRSGFGACFAQEKLRTCEHNAMVLANPNGVPTSMLFCVVVAHTILWPLQPANRTGVAASMLFCIVVAQVQ